MITLKEVSYTYDGASSPALDNVSMTVKPGEMVAVLGAQHSGTSTLCRLISGALADQGRTDGALSQGMITGRLGNARATSGAAHRGDELAAVMLGDDPEAQLTGMVTTVEDEIRLPGRLQGIPNPLISQRAAETMQRLHIQALAPRSTGTLSGGERQLTALASLLTVAPGVLVLDQPGLALDAGARTQLIHALRAHCADSGSVVLASHQHDDLTAACDHAVILETGRITHQGAVQELTEEQISRSGVWWALERTRRTDRTDNRADGAAAAQPCTAQPCTNPAARVPSGVSGRPQLQGLSVEGLGVQRGRTPIVENLSWTSLPGSVTSIVGPNGSGKSTVLRALAGLLPRRGVAVAGHITLNHTALSHTALTHTALAHTALGQTSLGGQPAGGAGVEAGSMALESLSAARRAPYIAWVGQDPGAQLSAATVRRELENALPRPRRKHRPTASEDRDRQIAEILDLTDLAGVADDHPYDLTPSQRKDLVIATAVLMKPAVLLLDEPTLGRDAAAMKVLTRVVTEVTAGGGAVVLTTHDQGWAERISDQLITLPPRG